MPPNQSTARKGSKSGPNQGGTLATTAKKERPTNQQDHIPQVEMKSMAADIKLLISEKESLCGVVRVLEGDVNTLKEQVEELMKMKSKEEPNAINDVIPIKSCNHQPYEASHAKSSASLKDTAKNSGTNIKKGGDLIKYLRAVGGWASTRKIIVGFISIALLASIVPRQEIVGKSSTLLWKQKGGLSTTPENMNKAGLWGGEVLVPKYIKDEGTPIVTPDEAFSDVTSTDKSNDASPLPKRRGRDASNRRERLQKAARPSKITSVKEGVSHAENLIQQGAGADALSRTLQANSMPPAMASDESEPSPASSNLFDSPVASPSPSYPDLRENNNEMASNTLPTATIRPSIPSDFTPSQSSMGPSSTEMPRSQRSTRPSALSPAPSLSITPSSQSPILEESWLERNALIQIYESAIGDRWKNRYGWLNPDISHCLWYGVYCDTNSTVLGLNLQDNHLSGELSKEIAGLKSLKRLDLGENNIKGSIPAEIGHLTDLEYIRLSYNDFYGTVPTEMGNLHQLELLQLHGNALSGAITNITIHPSQYQYDESSFIADCGKDWLDLDCEDCTLCCNYQGECEGNDNFTVVDIYSSVFAPVCFFILIIVFAVHAQDRWKKHRLPSNETDQESSLRKRDYERACEIIGTDSVYHFFMGKSWKGWAFALATVGVQILVLVPFVQGVPNKYLCAPGYYKCDVPDHDETTIQGYIAFFLIMAVHLSKDLINATKLSVLSCRARNSYRKRSRYDFAGFCLGLVPLATFFVSVLYNLSIAKSNTDWIVNSVVILFVTEVDERLYKVLRAINKHWVEITPLFTSCETGEDEHEDHDDDDGSQVDHDDDGSQLDSQSGGSQDLEGENQSLRQDVQSLSEVQQQNELLRDQNVKLNRLLELRREDDEAGRDMEGENQSLRQEVQSLSEVQQQNELLCDQNSKLNRLLELHHEDNIPLIS